MKKASLLKDAAPASIQSVPHAAVKQREGSDSCRRSRSVQYMGRANRAIVGARAGLLDCSCEHTPSTTVGTTAVFVLIPARPYAARTCIVSVSRHVRPLWGEAEKSSCRSGPKPKRVRHVEPPIELAIERLVCDRSRSRSGPVTVDVIPSRPSRPAESRSKPRARQTSSGRPFYTVSVERYIHWKGNKSGLCDRRCRGMTHLH